MSIGIFQDLRGLEELTIFSFISSSLKQEKGFGNSLGFLSPVKNSVENSLFRNAVGTHQTQHA